MSASLDGRPLMVTRTATLTPVGRAKNTDFAEEIAIERGVPIPNAGRPTSALREAMFRLQVGDSFLMPLRSTNTCHSKLWVWAKELGIKIARRTVIESGVKRKRIWRIS